MTINLFPQDKQRLAAALNALERARWNPTKANLDEAEKLVEDATRIVKAYVEPIHGTTAPIETLAMKRDARLFREATAELTPDERADFEKSFGFVPTIRRLAQVAQQEADKRWEASMQDWQAKQIDADMAERQKNQLVSNQTAGTNWQLIQETTEQIEKARLKRIEERRERALTSETWDEELPRVLATLDRDEQSIFTRLMEGIPSDLEAVQAYRASKGKNPLEGIEDTVALYDMHTNPDKVQAAGRAPKPAAAPDVSKVNDINQLYDIALKQALGER
jgi:hypothetical protein